MSSIIKTSFTQWLTVFCLLLLLAASASADPVNYQYDDLNRLERVEYADGTTILYGYDEVGNRVHHIQFNKNAAGLPYATMTINGGAATTASYDVTLNSLCAAADGECAEMQFSEDNVSWSDLEPYAPAKSWLFPDGEGTKTIYAKYTDSAGNWTSVVSDTIETDILAFDKEAPTTTASPGSGQILGYASITLSCDDNNRSGCDKTYYTTNGTDPTTASAVYTAPITIASSLTLKYFSVDLAGNAETVKSQTYEQLDTDLDGLPAAWELLYGLNPLLSDSDGDGVLDGEEDLDGDGLTNKQEFGFGTNPLVADTDGDGTSDYDEWIAAVIIPIINSILLN